MTLSDLASVGNLVSGIAVLVSLVYLAQQTRQNSKHTRALIQQGRALQSAENPLRHAENASLTELRLRGDEGDLTLDRVQYTRYFLMRVSVFWNWDDQFHQHRDGLLDSDRFAGTIRLMELQSQLPGCRSVWQQARMVFGSEFQSFLDNIMLGTHAAQFDSLAAWKAGVEAELTESGA
ncbi:MAG TPA: hypothetical protein VF459_16680 [Caulobacteraceae bacterium]